jgi:hypothetical protein
LPPGAIRQRNRQTFVGLTSLPPTSWATAGVVVTTPLFRLERQDVFTGKITAILSDVKVDKLTAVGTMRAVAPENQRASLR